MIDDSPEPGERLYTVHIFCDFDGTISGRDIGFDLFHGHGVQEPWHSRMLAREISVAEYWRGVFGTLDPAMTPGKLDEYLAGIPIDPGFGELLDLARRAGIRFTVVSDGFDLYIDRFLRLHGVEGVEVHANHAELVPGEPARVAFPNAAEGCECFCAGCKRNLVLGRPDATRAEVTAALRRAGLADWIDALPGGTDTAVGSGGVAVSGGERQRLALARALIAGRPMVLADEPGAHLDAPTARSVLTDLLAGDADRCTVVLVHERAQLDDCGGADVLLTLSGPGQ